MKTRRLFATALFIFAPLAAHAHPGHDGGHDLGWDFTAGALHPLGGLDHVLAMIAVGMWAAQLGRSARWALPAVFVAALAAGAALGAGGVMFSWSEQAIAASVLVLGLLVMTSARAPLGAGVALTACFAIFHGVAHGAEMPAGAGAAGYALGFMMVTGLLHVAGVALGSRALSVPRWTLRAGGALVAAAGGWLLVA